MIFSSFVIFVTFVVNGLFLFWLRLGRAGSFVVEKSPQETRKKRFIPGRDIDCAEKPIAITPKLADETRRSRPS
jgi:hypothetical protein